MNRRRSETYTEDYGFDMRLIREEGLLARYHVPLFTCSALECATTREAWLRPQERCA